MNKQKRTSVLHYASPFHIVPCASDPILLQQVRQAFTQFQQLLAKSPLEAQKTLLQTLVRETRPARGKIEDIEFELAPSHADLRAFEGSFTFSPPKPAVTCATVLRAVCNGKFKAPHN